MGWHKNVGVDKFPAQYKSVGKKVEVCFFYGTSVKLSGVIVRDDKEEPLRTIIKLDDGRHIMGGECLFWVKDEVTPEQEKLVEELKRSRKEFQERKEADLNHPEARAAYEKTGRLIEETKQASSDRDDLYKFLMYLQEKVFEGKVEAQYLGAEITKKKLEIILALQEFYSDKEEVAEHWDAFWGAAKRKP